MKDGKLIKNEFGTFKVVHVGIFDGCLGCCASADVPCGSFPDCTKTNKKDEIVESWIYVKVEDKTNG